MLRPWHYHCIEELFQSHPIVALLGPRQCGKTTLAQAYLAAHQSSAPENYYDLENDNDLARLQDPMLALAEHQGLIVIDEVQLQPELFPRLRVLIDKHRQTQRYLLLGSASPQLIQHTSETLAGRIAYHELTPFSFRETQDLQLLWLRGGFPNSYLASSDLNSSNWRKQYIRTFLERDIPNLGIRIPANQLRRFWMMIAHYHGNIFNASELGRSLELNHKTIKHYADILTDTFMIRQLQPWFENISKRQVKSPKIYIRDSGLLHSLYGIETHSALLMHPKLGASWEGFALEEIIRCHNAEPQECYFWATHGETELDLLIVKDGKKIGFEFKHSSAPRLTTSMKTAKELLQLETLHVLYPGDKSYPLAEGIRAQGLLNYLQRNNI